MSGEDRADDLVTEGWNDPPPRVAPTPTPSPAYIPRPYRSEPWGCSGCIQPILVLLALGSMAFVSEKACDSCDRPSTAQQAFDMAEQADFDIQALKRRLDTLESENSELRERVESLEYEYGNHQHTRSRR